MQTETVSRLWLCGRSWKFKIPDHYAFLEVIHLFQQVGCARNKLLFLTVQQNLKSSLPGHWTEIGWFACSGIMGSNCFCLWKRLSIVSVLGNISRVSDRTGKPARGNLRVMNTNTTNLTRKSMWWKTLILFLQMSNPRVKKLYCTCLRTMKLWSRWSLKAEVLQWDMFPELTELLLIGCSIELIWTPKSKSNTSTPKTNSQTS